MSKLVNKGFPKIQGAAKYKAVAKHIRMSSNKALRVARQLRGRPYLDALRILNCMPYRACEPILKVLRSAAANVYENMRLSYKSLFVLRTEVNEGPPFKRFRPRARGRGYRIQKPTCHITIILQDKHDPNSFIAKKKNMYGKQNKSTWF
uniref:Large ribosomal subunit protein uL22c n=2 Tax=Taiwania TaxID=25613 RepID=A0A6M3TW68_9CONI|nr:ribosomal protein L22 [Taiwania cryptomerioides]QJE37027.1 ribosomal protein L22 [Taiwania flousiana]BAK86844.1 ribosomal protein L22 [Taiwania cryptomerioides]